MSEADSFEQYRDDLLAHAYRMLGELSRAQDIVQNVWLRWSRRQAAPSQPAVAKPRAYLLKAVTNLCLNELSSARARTDRQRPTVLPEAIDLSAGPLARLEIAERVSMAFMVALQRLTPAERAVLLLHEVFDFPHDDIAQMMGKSPSACRKLLSRARVAIAEGRRDLQANMSVHRQLLVAFASAAASGDVTALSALLCADVELTVDAGDDV